MEDQAIFVALRDALTEIYPEEQDAYALVLNIGMDTRRIAFSTYAQINWHNILSEAIRQQYIDALLQASLSDFGNNKSLLAGYAKYRLLIENGGYIVFPKQLFPTGKYLQQTSTTRIYAIDNVGLSQSDLVEPEMNVDRIVGRDIIGSLMAGDDYSQIFVNDYRALQRDYINPGSVFNRVNLKYFCERRWLLAEVDKFLQSHDRGYFILEAESGLGKTTFMAWLAKRRHYIHHFSELARGQDGIGIALRSLAVQLILAYELQPEEANVNAFIHPTYLNYLIKKAASQLREGEKLVLIVDGLDESYAPLNQNVLGLPSLLPEGVYVIASQRPGCMALQIETSPDLYQAFRLSASDPNHQNDIHSFLTQCATQPNIIRLIQDNRYTVEQFISTVLDKCQGVWLYLDYIVHEIEDATLPELKLTELPNNLTEYYVNYWHRWRNLYGENEWNKCYLLLLTTLAVAQEAISCQLLLIWSNADCTEALLDQLLQKRWHHFLACEDHGKECRYRFCHSSVQEFFNGQLEHNNVSTEHVTMIETFRNELCLRHGYLANRYLQAWGGLESELPQLEDAEKRDLDDQYGLRHLAAHLESANRTEDLHALLRVQRFVPNTEYLFEDENNSTKAIHINKAEQKGEYQNAWYLARKLVGQIDGYLVDVMRASRLVEKHDFDEISEEIDDRHLPKWIGLHYRYALIIASIKSFTWRPLIELLTALVKNNIWLPQQSLAYLHQATDLNQRVVTLINLACYLPISTEQKDAIKEALYTVERIKDNARQVSALIDLALHLSEEQWSTVLHITEHMENDYDKEKALANLAPYMPASQLQVAVRIIQCIGYHFPKAEALSSLAIRQTQLGKLQDALHTARSIKHSPSKAKALANLASYLPADQQDRILQEALNEVLVIKSRSYRSYALSDLVCKMAGMGRIREAQGIVQNIEYRSSRSYVLSHLASQSTKLGQLKEALRTAQSIEENDFRSYALADLASHFSVGEQGEILQEAIRGAQDIKDSFSRSYTLSHVVSRMTELGQVHEALYVARCIEDSDLQISALCNLLSHLSAGEKEEILKEALHIAQHIENSHYRAKALSDLAPYLSAEQLQDALRTAQSIDDCTSQSYALANLVPQLAKLGQLQEALHIANYIKSVNFRVTVLFDLAPYLSADEYEKMWQVTLDMVQSIKHFSSRTKIQFNITARLTKLGRFQEALEMAQSIEDAGVRIKALSNLMPLLMEMPPQKLYFALRSAIYSSISRDGTSLFADLGVSAGVVSYVGGRSALVETIKAIEDVSRWWS